MRHRGLHIYAEQFHKRLINWKHATLDKLKHRNWRVWLIVVFVLYVILEAVRAIISDSSILLMVWLFRGLAWLIKQPMGLGGLAFITFWIVLLCTAWWQSRPKSVSKRSVLPQLSEVDRRLVQDLRTIWNRHGVSAVSQLQAIFGDVVYDLKKSLYWGVLLDAVHQDLGRSIEGMTKAVAADSLLSISDVRELFNYMYSHYFEAMKWLAKLQVNGDARLEGKSFEYWKECHYEFYERLLDLNEVPDHHDTMRIFANIIEDEAFRKFLKAAQTRPHTSPSKEDTDT